MDLWFVVIVVAGNTGLDYSVKKITEVYHKKNHKENQNFIYVITIPHSFRRMFIEDNGMSLVELGLGKTNRDKAFGELGIDEIPKHMIS